MVNGQGRKSATVAKAPEWKPNLCSYKDTRLLKFKTSRDLEAAIELLWSEPLETLPHDTPDGRSIIIPAEAVDYFSRAGIEFTVEKLRSISELSYEEIKHLRRKR